jgi:hypothetical protein
MYEARWSAVSHFVNKILIPNMVDDVQAEYCGMEFDRNSILLDEEDQTFCIVQGNSIFEIYNGDVDHDEGAHDTILVTRNRLENEFKLYKIIPLVAKTS